jgi:predicted DNA-binding transcriptional regulator AlpA
MNNTNNNLLTESEVAPLIGLSVHWLRRMRWAGGGIPFIKMGAAVRYRLDDVQSYIGARVRKSTSDPGKLAA